MFTPSKTYRVRWNMFSDTPLPPEEPTGENPPDGAILDYQLNQNAQAIKLEIVDKEGTIIRTYVSDDLPEEIDTTALAHPTYWIKPAQTLGRDRGHHRFVWDLRYTPPRGSKRQFSIAAVYQSTPTGPHGPYVKPGTYRVRLTVDGETSEKPFEVLMDPRVTISEEALQLQTDLSMACYDAYHELQNLVEEIDAMNKPKETHLAFRGDGAVGDPDTMYGSIRHVNADAETLVGLQHKMLFMLNLLQVADVQPTTQTQAGVEKLMQTKTAILARWNAIK